MLLLDDFAHLRYHIFTWTLFTLFNYLFKILTTRFNSVDQVSQFLIFVFDYPIKLCDDILFPFLHFEHLIFEYLITDGES